MGDQRLPENQPGQVTRHNCVLKQKKEQLALPLFMEGKHWLFSHEKQEDFARDYVPCEEILSQTMQETLFPRICREPPSTVTNKRRRKLSRDLGLLCSMSADQKGSRRTQYNLDHLFQMEDDAENHFINLLQMPKHDWNLNKWPNLENQREANKNSKNGKCLHRKFNLGIAENSRLCQGNFLSRNTSRNQNLLDSLKHRFPQRRGNVIYEWNEVLGNLGVLQQLEMNRAYQPSCKESSDKKVCHPPSKLKYFRGLSKEKDIRFSKPASSIFEMELQKPHDRVKSTKEKFKYGPSYQKPKQLKSIASKEPITDPKNLLEIQGFHCTQGLCYAKYTQEVFMRKGWNYNSVNMPILRILKNHEMIMQKQEDVDNEKKRGKEL
uniref:Uncharacterized protein n=1 Tax=Cricetulus griseus TaxID=10029 RepID=A0A8C2M3W9_CRIGR